MGSKTRRRYAEANFGPNLARLRRERGITQVELAKKLGLQQSMISHYERGSLRMHGGLLAKLCEILGATADELIGRERTAPANAVEDRRFLRRFQNIERLSKRDKLALLRTIDAFLAKAS